MKTPSLKPLFAGLINCPPWETVAKFPAGSKQRDNKSDKNKIPLTLKQAQELAGEIPLFSN